MEVYDFGLRLQKLRKRRKLTQAAVARHLNLHYSTISAYERNIAVPSLDVLIELARLYGASLDYIVGLKEHEYIFVDDLPLNQRKFIAEIVATMKQEFSEFSGE